MSGTEQRRARILTKLLVGEVTVAEAAALLELSQRQVWPLKVRFEREGPAGLVHANRGRASPRRLAEPLRARIVELARGRHAGVNDSHLAELLAEHEAIVISLAALRRLLRGAGLASPRRRRRPRQPPRPDAAGRPVAVDRRLAP